MTGCGGIQPARKAFYPFPLSRACDELVVESCGNGKNDGLYLRVIEDVFEPRNSFRSANLLGLT